MLSGQMSDKRRETPPCLVNETTQFVTNIPGDGDINREEITLLQKGHIGLANQDPVF